MDPIASHFLAVHQLIKEMTSFIENSVIYYMQRCHLFYMP